jgi:hypothetical protein
LDGDGDGYSDLDELLAGTGPTNAMDFPTSRIEQGAVYDLVLTPRPYDGSKNQTDTGRVDTQVRLFSASGGQLDFTKTENVALGGISITNPAAHFAAVPLSLEPPLVTTATEIWFDTTGGFFRNQSGVELVGLYVQPTSAVTEVDYTYQGGALSTEAANWLSAARFVYTNAVRDVVVDDLGLDETLAGMLAERKLADLLYARGTASTNWLSLFKGRAPDSAMAGFTSSGLQSLESIGPGDEPAYHLPTLVSFLRDEVDNLPALKGLTQDIYDICSSAGWIQIAGKYPLPVDVLREFLFTGTLHSNYLAKASITPTEVSTAYSEAIQVLGLVPSRPVWSFSLEVRADSFDSACPVLYTGGSMAKSLYTSEGRPFKFPATFTLQPGAQVSVEAFTDPEWNLCPGTEPLEVISLALTAVPTASGADEDGNLIPDDYEEIFLVGSGGQALSDLDNDGFSDLQEYLDGTDPNNSASFSGGGPVELSPPFIWIQGTLLSIDWPVVYTDAFVFTIEYTEDLTGTAFAPDQELPSGALDATLDLSAEQNFYRVNMRLR